MQEEKKKENPDDDGMYEYNARTEFDKAPSIHHLSVHRPNPTRRKTTRHTEKNRRERKEKKGCRWYSQKCNGWNIRRISCQRINASGGDGEGLGTEGSGSLC